MRNKFYILLTMLLLTAFIGCSDDADPIVGAEPQYPELQTEVTSLEVAIDKISSLKILQGAGDYNAFSLEKDIVDVEVKGDEILLKGISVGQTDIMILDKAGACVQVAVTSAYDRIVVSAGNEITMDIKIGETEKVTFDILYGSGGYEVATEENQNIIKDLSLKDDTHVSFKVVSAGTTTLTITDKMGKTATVTVTVNELSYPYSPEELNEIRKKTGHTFSFMYRDRIEDGVYDGKIYDNQTAEDGRIYYRVEDNWGDVEFRIDFKGDFTVGVKENATLNTFGVYTHIENQDITLEIIKNDGKTIWTIFYYVGKDYNDERALIYGYFIRPIKSKIENIGY